MLKSFEDQIQILQNQVNSLALQRASLTHQVKRLQNRIVELENQTNHFKNALRHQNKASDAMKLTKQDDYTLNSEVRDPTYGGKEMESKSFSEASKMTLETLSQSQQYNVPSNTKKDLNGSNFITLRQISEEGKIEVIKTGFQLQSEDKISLKKYYEGVSEANSLFQHKVYSIKYETIRHTKLYQQLKL